MDTRPDRAEPSESRPRSGGQAVAGAHLQRWAPGLHALLHYRRAWLAHDLMAGLALGAVLVPVGMGYAQASGLEAIHGLYATIAALLAYAVFGPSRTLVLGPDSTLAAVIVALILPLAGGSAERAVALACALALMSAGLQLLIGLARLGIVADLFSKPIRLGFLNAIALTVIAGQLPALLGLSVAGDTWPASVARLAEGVVAGQAQPAALAIGAGCLAAILALRACRPRWPGVLMAILAVTLLSAWLDLGRTAGVALLGPMPQGLPVPQLPAVGLPDLGALLPGAAVIALLSFADTSVLSRALEARDRARVSQDQEMLALGAANIAAGMLQGFPVSASASRTAVADAAGSRSPLTGVVGATLIALLLIVAPDLLRDVPAPALAAVVIAACLSFADVRGMFALARMHRAEFALSVSSFLGVAFLGVVQGVGIAVLLSVMLVIWNAWNPYTAILVRVDGRKGWHDGARHPEGRAVPGLLILRWDAPLFFANGEVLRERVLHAVSAAAQPPRRVILAADAISQIDVTAAESLGALERDLREQGIELHFAGLKGVVKDCLPRLGLSAVFGPRHFWPTVGSAVDDYRAHHAVQWRDWDEDDPSPPQAS